MSVDIEVDLRPLTTDIRDQGRRGTCLAHATTAAHEFGRGECVPLSVEYLHHFASGGREDGASFDKVMDVMRGQGQPVEIDCRYQSSQPPKGWAPSIGLQVFKADLKVYSPSVDHVLSILRSGRMAVIGISIPDSFYRPQSPWVIESDGPIRGLHAVTCVGLGVNEIHELILVRNSWGASWGDQGCCWLTRNFLERHLKELFALKKKDKQ